MTIHKSKGLEFHTMIFYGLDNQTWWSPTPDRMEELLFLCGLHPREAEGLLHFVR